MASERTSREASQASRGPVSVVRRSSAYLLEETNGELGIDKRRSGILVERPRACACRVSVGVGSRRFADGGSELTGSVESCGNAATEHKPRIAFRRECYWWPQPNLWRTRCEHF